MRTKAERLGLQLLVETALRSGVVEVVTQPTDDTTRVGLVGSQLVLSFHADYVRAHHAGMPDHSAARQLADGCSTEDAAQAIRGALAELHEQLEQQAARYTGAALEVSALLEQQAAPRPPPPRTQPGEVSRVREVFIRTAAGEDSGP